MGKKNMYEKLIRVLESLYEIDIDNILLRNFFFKPLPLILTL